MSGGGNKKKMMRTQGWEEAGSEFYQESYPTDAEFDVIQRDPRHLATLLPSKQTRAATTLRFRTNDNRTIARRQTAQRNRWESIGTRGTSTVGGDVQVSMMPDLSGDVSNEQKTWENIMDIKVLPVPMAHKREMKSKILNQPNLRLQGYEELNWKRRKMWRQFQTSLKETYANLTLWKGSLKRIEGQFGTGVVAYFLFLKYLLILNFFIFVMVFAFITLPTILLAKPSDCLETQFDILDLLQGTGFMQCTLLYYGTYPREIFAYSFNGATMYYNIPLAYICVYLVCFAVPLICIVRSGASGLKERLVEGEGQFYQYCNLIFGGWDFCIQNEKSARIKHKALYVEIAQCLAAERSEEQRQNRTRNQNIKLYTARVIVNIIVVGVLAACGCGIYFVFDYCTNATGSHYEELLFQFLPSITIVGMNMLVPFLFKYLITFEQYSPAFVIRMLLLRTVILRLASIFMLCVSLYSEIKARKDQCWETFVGQQIYKLVLTDFGTVVLLTFVLNYPRALLARKFNKNSFFVIIGDQSFDLPKHVLDVVYSQTLCWLGCFYAPLLTVMFTIIFFLVFLIKKFACLQNSNPSSTIYRASRSESMFMIVLLFSFVSAFVPLAFSISDITPSSDCGPFKGLQSVWSEIANMFLESPMWVQDVAAFLTTTGFAIPLFIVLFMSFYYYRAVNSANRHMVSVLKNQLVLEGHDKQFLLERLSRLQIGDNTISTTN